MIRDDQRKLTRQHLTLIAAVMAAVLSLGAVAWACGEIMIGNIWFCHDGATDCNYPQRQGLFAANSTKRSSADALSANLSYYIRYMTPNNSHTACISSTNQFSNLTDGGNTFAADGSGAWLNKSVTMPSQSGSYRACAISVDETSAATDPDGEALFTIL